MMVRQGDEAYGMIMVLNGYAMINEGIIWNDLTIFVANH